MDDTWCSDLVDMQKLSRWNKGYKYLLMILDLFSKYGWIVPLKTKTGLEVSKAFESIFKKGKPKKLWVDKGKEYYNKNMLDLLAKNISKSIPLKMKKSHLFVRDGTELLKKKCTNDLLCKITLSTSRFYRKYSLLTITAKIDQ